MFRINEHGTHAVIWKDPNEGRSGCFEVYNVLTNKYLGDLPVTARIIDISWPFLAAVVGTGLEFYRAKGHYYSLLRKISMLVEGIVFVQPQRLFVIWQTRQNKKRWWGFWRIAKDNTVVCEQSGVLGPDIKNVTAAAPSLFECTTVQLETHYYDVPQQCFYKDRPCGSGLVPVIQPWPASNSVSFCKGPFKIHWQPFCIKVISDDGAQTYKWEGRQGVAISTNLKWIVTANRQANDLVFFERNKMPTADPCGTYTAMKERLKTDTEFNQIYNLFNTILPVSSFVVDDIMLLW